MINSGGTKVAIVGIDNPPVPKIDTQETENLDKAIFLFKRVQAGAPPAKPIRKHKMANRGSSLYP
jgi:hypothetical protein